MEYRIRQRVEYYVSVSSKGSDETARTRSLVRTLAASLYDRAKSHTLVKVHFIRVVVAEQS